MRASSIFVLLALVVVVVAVAAEDDAVDAAPEGGDQDAVDAWRVPRVAKRRVAAGNASSPRTPTTVGKRTASTKRVAAGTTPTTLSKVTFAGVNSTMATSTAKTTTTAKSKKKASLAKTTPTTPSTPMETPKLYYPSRRPRPEPVVEKTPAKPMGKPSGKPMGGPRLPEGATAAGLTKPTKYHYYPHNQHIYLLPECAIQQVCNAVYVRLNFTQPLCACPTRYQEPCSASLRSDDLHTTPLVTDPRGRALTLVKTCEPVAEMRKCKAPRDWALLALQNVRTGKSHYLVLCRCPADHLLEGPMNHDQPNYASVPGIRVYGMMCVQTPAKRQARPLRTRRHLNQRRTPALPWTLVQETVSALGWDP